MSKQSKTDLPGTDLLFGSHTNKATAAAKETIEKIEEKPTIKISNLKNVKTINVDSSEPVKFTFYFDPQLLEDLEVAKFRLRMEKRIKISKSDIVNASLEYCMKDLNFLERLVKGDLD